MSLDRGGVPSLKTYGHGFFLLILNLARFESSNYLRASIRTSIGWHDLQGQTTRYLNLKDSRNVNVN